MALSLEDAVILSPELLHTLHTQLSKNKLEDSDAERASSSLMLESNLAAERRKVSARGKISHIRRVSRHTTFVDITLQHSDPPLRQLSNQGSEIEKSTAADFPNSFVGSSENVSEGEAAQETRRKEAHDEVSGCPYCVRMELLVPGEVLATLPQKLRIGSVVECTGEHLENLAEGKYCMSPADNPILNLSLLSDAEQKLSNFVVAERAIDSLERGHPTESLLLSSKSKGSAQPDSDKLLSKETRVSLAGSQIVDIQDPQGLRLEDKLHIAKESSFETETGLQDVDSMLKVSSLTVTDPRGSTTGNVLLDKSLAVKGELSTRCFGGKKISQRNEVCKFWVNEGRCVRGADCAYQHPPHGDQLKKARAAYLEAKAKAHHHSGNAGKAKRAQVFADWICKTFDKGSKTLRVMDVAAGAHGELAFHLAEKGVFCTSVEPRERKLTKAQRKALTQKGIVLPKDCTTPALPESLVGAQMRELFQDNNHWTEIVRRDATLLVGLHPDEVTEAVVDVALRANVPFAVMPCCVFPKMFPGRRIGGRPVATHEDFVEYLLSKGDAYGKTVEKETLKFAGSNVVLFTRT